MMNKIRLLTAGKTHKGRGSSPTSRDYNANKCGNLCLLFFRVQPFGWAPIVSTVQVFVGSSRRVWRLVFGCGRVPLNHSREKWIQWISAPASTIVWFGNLWTAQAYLGIEFLSSEENAG